MVYFDNFSPTETNSDLDYTSRKAIENRVSSVTEPGETKTDANLKKAEYKLEIVWVNVIGYITLHALGVYGFKLFLLDVSWMTAAWFVITTYLGGIGITLGTHRLWCHRSYSATIPLKLFLCMCNCISLQDCIFEWSRNHRVHHKYSETDADPYNAKRGFFFCHMGWLMCKKHPDVKEKGKGIDLNDLRSDPIVMFQRRWYLWLCSVFSIYLPTIIPHYLWGEDIWDSFFVSFVLRYLMVMHGHCYINSGAHLWGNRPYDRTINPAENFWASVFGLGEGFHNYHHTFPWDYSTSEWGWKLNLSTLTIDIFARMGLAYNLKTVPQDIVNRRRELKGDGSKPWYPEILHYKKKIKQQQQHEDGETLLLHRCK